MMSMSSLCVSHNCGDFNFLSSAATMRLKISASSGSGCACAVVVDCVVEKYLLIVCRQDCCSSVTFFLRLVGRVAVRAGGVG